MKKLLTGYLILCGIVANLVIIIQSFDIYDQIFVYASKVKQATRVISDDVNTYTKVKIDNASQYRNNQTLSDYYAGKFVPLHWPTVGPRNHYQAFTSSRYVVVDSEDSLLSAIKSAQPGDEIIIQNGHYFLEGKRFTISDIPPSPLKPIILRSEQLGEVNIYLDAVEGILIDQPNWQIEGINFIGQCKDHSRCEHAIHIVGEASNTIIRNNTFYDFNAAIKVNELSQQYPDNGIIENNVFGMHSPRDTNHSVTPINLDHGNNWTIRKNIIHDFIKLGGNKVSYGAFMKGGIHSGVIEQNLVVCNSKPNRYVGSQVGLSFGGGGIDRHHRRNKVDYEVTDSVIRNNIIIHCNDVGIYSQRSRNVTINNNIIYNTLGIDIRFDISTANVFNNIISGRVKNRDNATSTKHSNYIYKDSLFSNKESLNSIYKAPNQGDFRIENGETLLDITLSAPELTETSVDFCNNIVEAGQTYIGAIYDDSLCFKP